MCRTNLRMMMTSQMCRINLRMMTKSQMCRINLRMMMKSQMCRINLRMMTKSQMCRTNLRMRMKNQMSNGWFNGTNVARLDRDNVPEEAPSIMAMKMRSYISLVDSGDVNENMRNEWRPRPVTTRLRDLVIV